MLTAGTSHAMELLQAPAFRLGWLTGSLLMRAFSWSAPESAVENLRQT